MTRKVLDIYMIRKMCYSFPFTKQKGEKQLQNFNHYKLKAAVVYPCSISTNIKLGISENDQLFYDLKPTFLPLINISIHDLYAK